MKNQIFALVALAALASSAVQAPPSQKRLTKDLFRDGLIEHKAEYGVESVHVDNEDSINNVYVVFAGPKKIVSKDGKTTIGGEFEGGQYVLRIQLIDNVHGEGYPLAAPRLEMLTPCGKFDPYRHDICVSGISHLHRETWSPTQNLSGIVKGFISFMTDKQEYGGDNSGAIRKAAQESHAYNVKHVFPIIPPEIG